MTPEDLAAIRARIEATTAPQCGNEWRRAGRCFRCTKPAGHVPADDCEEDRSARRIRPADALALLVEVDRLQRIINDTEASALSDAIFAARHE